VSVRPSTAVSADAVGVSRDDVAAAAARIGPRPSPAKAPSPASWTSKFPEVDTVLVTVGGLIGGIAAWSTGHRGHHARIVAVEPERIPTLAAALVAGHGVDVQVGDVAADSLGAQRIGAVGVAAAQAAQVHSVLFTTTRPSRRGNDCRTACDWRPKQAAPPPWPLRRPIGGWRAPVSPKPAASEHAVPGAGWPARTPREVLLGYLDYFRCLVVSKVQGLSNAQLRVSPAAAARRAQT